MVQGVGERHLTAVVMVAVGFAVGGDVNELRPGSFLGESAQQAGSARFSPLSSRPSNATPCEIGPS